MWKMMSLKMSSFRWIVSFVLCFCVMTVCAQTSQNNDTSQGDSNLRRAVQESELEFLKKEIEAFRTHVETEREQFVDFMKNMMIWVTIVIGVPGVIVAAVGIIVTVLGVKSHADVKAINKDFHDAKNQEVARFREEVDRRIQSFDDDLKSSLEAFIQRFFGNTSPEDIRLTAEYIADGIRAGVENLRKRVCFIVPRERQDDAERIKSRLRMFHVENVEIRDIPELLDISYELYIFYIAADPDAPTPEESEIFRRCVSGLENVIPALARTEKPLIVYAKVGRVPPTILADHDLYILANTPLSLTNGVVTTLSSLKPLTVEPLSPLHPPS